MSAKFCDVKWCTKKREKGSVLCSEHESAYVACARGVPLPLPRSGWARKRKARKVEATR